MLNAVLKVVAITAAVVILAAVAVLLTRVNAFRQQAQVPPHPWFDRPDWSLAAPAPDAWCQTPTAPAANQILVLPVRKAPARWEVACADAPALAEVLSKVALHDVVFDIEAGIPEDLDNFVDIVNNAGVKRVGIHAASQRAARHLRKKQPGWAFAADDASLVRLHLFASLFLEPAMDFWPDFVLTDAGDARSLNARELAELHRRRKRVVWADPTHEPTLAVDGRVRYEAAH